MPIKPGTKDDFEDSLADYIDRALQEAWRQEKGTELPEAGHDDRKILCIAIAQGIVRYLQINQASLVKSLQVIQEDNNLIKGSGQLVTPSNTVTVTQDTGDQNKVKSRMTGGTLEIDTEGEEVWSLLQVIPLF